MRLCQMIGMVLLSAAIAAGHAAMGAEPPGPPCAALSPLRWAADAEGGAPYIFKDAKDPTRNVGFEVDLAAALEKELGRKIEFVQYQFPSLIAGLRRGDFDLAMNGLEITPDRARAVRFSRPYYVYKLQLVARSGEKRFASLDACRAAGGLVGTLEDTAAERLLDEMLVNKRIYDGQVEPYLDLELGRIDAVLLDLPIAIYYARPNKKLRFVGEPLGRGYYAIAVAREREDLATEVDAALERIAQSGRLRQIYEQWGIWNEDQEALFAGPQAEGILREVQGRWTPADYLPLLVQGAWVTIQVSVLSMLLAIALGLPVALARLSPWLPLRVLATVYVEFFRGIPVLLLLFFLYFGLPTVGVYYGLPFSLNLSAFAAAVIGFGLNYGAYEAEIYRAGIGAIPIGQWEAAASLGMSRGLAFRRIIFPQAIRIILPPMTNDFIALFKDTSLVSVIAVVELTKQYQILAKSSLKYLEIGLATAALYLVMSVPLGYLSRYLEKRWGKGT
jgi:polar amino acid transport system substrate-binding protein